MSLGRRHSITRVSNVQLNIRFPRWAYDEAGTDTSMALWHVGIVCDASVRAVIMK